MSDNATIVKILDRAAEYAELGQDCLTSLWHGHVAAFPGRPGREFEAAVNAVGMHLGLTTFNPWNDDPGRTQQEVVDTLRAVARKLEAEG